LASECSIFIVLKFSETHEKALVLICGKVNNVVKALSFQEQFYTL